MKKKLTKKDKRSFVALIILIGMLISMFAIFIGGSFIISPEAAAQNMPTIIIIVDAIIEFFAVIGRVILFGYVLFRDTLSTEGYAILGIIETAIILLLLPVLRGFSEKRAKDIV